MDTVNDLETPSKLGLQTSDTLNKSEQSGTDGKQNTAKQLPIKKAGGIGKNSANYWQGRIFKPNNSRGEASPHFFMRVSFRGHRMGFTLGTSNQAAAAKIAAGIYSDLLTLGKDATLAKHRPDSTPGETSTLGEWIDAAKKVFDGSDNTFEGYARSARMIAADIQGTKRTKKRFGRKGGEFREAVDKIPLSIFSARAVQEWKIAYVKKRGETSPVKQRAARISCNTVLRGARSLFQDKLARHLPSLTLTEKPFAKVTFYPRESMRYHSKIDPAILLAAARKELAESDPEAFKILLLALGAGLRRGEIDRLLWRQIDLKGGAVHVEVTEAGDLKSADSTGMVSIDETLCALLQGFKAKATSQYVVEGSNTEGRSLNWGTHYRCQQGFDSLLAWLRKNGVEERRALHTLRKEAGSIIATKSGIFAASRFLRHADIQVTAQHYADTKERVSIDLGGLMNPPNVTPFPAQKETRRSSTSHPKRAHN